MIYLASPYTHEDPEIMEYRFRMACRKAGQLMSEGQIVFSPIAHTHPIAIECSLPRGWDFWNIYDRQMIGFCDKLVVFKLPGWETSKGVNGEIEIARQLNKPVEFIECIL